MENVKNVTPHLGNCSSRISTSTILFVTEDYCATWIRYVKKAKKMSTHDGRGHLQSTSHFNGTILLTPLSVNEKSHTSHLFTLALFHVFKLFSRSISMILP